MKLYYAPGTCAVAPWIVAEWAGVDYEVEKAKLGTDDYTKINPLGSVPALVLNDGQVITQATAIMNYIAKQNPSADLLSSGSDVDDAKLAEILSFLASDFHAAFWPVFGPQKFTTSQEEQDFEPIREAAYKRIDRVLTNLDRLIGDGEHVYKNKRTLADAYAYVMTQWSKKTPKDFTNYPNVKRFMEAMDKDEAVQKVMAESVK
ncbi:glutathione S-transferase family protein [Taylorella equigenitalis]|uniref:Glutathione S-transferase n=1 Tax=Taylorella equigenitalis ATCC 35865 TaxID=743973 RepID=A0ABM5NC76_9BURK|nr:glutathione S-transferase N-terminal domain-containing protein [Taylorella equigenitalis]AFN36579.1 putative glutathione S-transferase [Taylorella equigenitalis ATCC 35865]ASY31145.1 glutathione S-transferase [Taylorella equigenitalis]ASY38445.1 glutathione S-transferase [Taylorella equigenitalis]ASY39981.1 glutathione S-transferase [Taylorella equigenitalis]ASY41424.1 glutathione S-transferase [Taylorella equigenitalis]